MKETGTRAKQGVVLRTEALTVTTGTCDLFVPISVSIPVHQVFGILGPSGAGKSTFLKCLNRLIDLTPNLRVKGDVFDLRQRH
ncbi:MAG TPA: ATP-binding cassette domain-containing protein [Candidatus Limnocylindria bacterium]|nr:ATP-binding cassette domain-containing protein [Candidatus Limnocylindria bacterium]